MAVARSSFKSSPSIILLTCVCGIKRKWNSIHFSYWFPNCLWETKPTFSSAIFYCFTCLVWMKSRVDFAGQTDGFNEAVSPLERSFEPDQSQIELRSFNVARSQSNLGALRHLTVGRFRNRGRIQWTGNGDDVMSFVAGNKNRFLSAFHCESIRRRF
jgi:hypothetical protein